MYNHHGLFNKKWQKNSKKITIDNALQAETVKAAGLKFAGSIPITIRELLKKRLIDICSGTRIMAILKSLLFRDGALSICAYCTWNTVQDQNCIFFNEQCTMKNKRIEQKQKSNKRMNENQIIEQNK
jgi:hypothetical protein